MEGGAVFYISVLSFGYISCCFNLCQNVSQTIALQGVEPSTMFRHISRNFALVRHRSDTPNRGLHNSKVLDKLLCRAFPFLCAKVGINTFNCCHIVTKELGCGTRV